MNVQTTDLRPGDVLDYDGTRTETVVSVELPEAPCVIAKVNVVRHIYGRHVPTHFLSGIKAVHEVTR